MYADRFGLCGLRGLPRSFLFVTNPDLPASDDLGVSSHAQPFFLGHLADDGCIEFEAVDVFQQ